jgi:transcriptional regulator with XRE-family HTH domain
MTTSTHEGYEDLELTVGDRLRRARERRTHLDQAEFADLIHVSRGTVSNYERDMIPGGPRRKLVFNSWATATGVTVEWLETGGPVEGSGGPDDGQPSRPYVALSAA